MLTPQGAADRGATSGPALRRETARSKNRHLRDKKNQHCAAKPRGLGKDIVERPRTALRRETAKSKQRHLRLAMKQSRSGYQRAFTRSYTSPPSARLAAGVK